MTIGELLETRDENNSGMKRCNSFCDYTNEDLFKAVKEKKSVKIRCLINNGVDVNSKDEDGWTALMYAVDYNDKAISRLLIELGADVNIRNDEGQTALMNAIFINAIEIAKMLIKNGADFNIRDNAGQTPLMIAALSNAKEIVELLILEGSDVFAVDNLGIDAFVIASKTSAFKKSDYFLKTRPTQELINAKRLDYILKEHFSMEEGGCSVEIDALKELFKNKYAYELTGDDLDVCFKIINKDRVDKEFKIINKRFIQLVEKNNNFSMNLLHDFSSEMIKTPSEINDESVTAITKNPRDFWDGFEQYLIQLGYKQITPSGMPSTAPLYRSAVSEIKFHEGKTLQAFCLNIDSIIPLYDTGGLKEALGNTQHRTWINGLKRFREYLLYLIEKIED